MGVGVKWQLGSVSRKHPRVHQSRSLLLAVLPASSSTRLWEARGGGGGKPESGQWVTKAQADLPKRRFHPAMPPLKNTTTFPIQNSPTRRCLTPLAASQSHITVPPLLKSPFFAADTRGWLQSGESAERLPGVERLGAAYVLCNLCPFYLPTEQLHSVPAASPRAGANPHISVYSDDGY